MIFLALDPSINETGWALGRGASPAESGVIRTKGTTDAEKLADLVIELRNVIDLCQQYEPKEISAAVEVPESFTYGRSAKNGKSLNTASLMKLSRAIGVILQTVQKAGCVVEEVPASWKGRAGKQTVKAITGKSNHNEADAVCLYRWYSGMRAVRGLAKV